METTNTILDIKKKLQEKEGVDTHAIKLTMNGEDQRDDITLESVKMKAGSNNVRMKA